MVAMGVRRWARWAALCLAAGLAACGGGGGGSKPEVSFSPSTLSTNVQSGSSATLTVRATARDPEKFRRLGYVYLVDPDKVLLNSLELSAVDERTISATLHTSPLLTAGRHQGRIQVQLCEDPGCSVQLAGSPYDLDYDLNISEMPLSASPISPTALTVHRGGSLRDAIGVQVKGPMLSWTATASESWLQVTTLSGTGPGVLSVDVPASALAEGHYSADVIVRASDGQTATVPVTLDVLPTQFVLTSGVPSFVAVNGAPIAAQPLGFALDNEVPTPWSASTSAAWLLATPTHGTTPATVSLQPDPSIGRLPSGSHQADLVLSAGGVPSRRVTTQLALTAPTLSASSTVVTLGGPKGRDLVSPGTLAMSLNTGANSWPFTLSTLPAWLSSSTTSGRVGGSGSVLSLQAVAAAATPGSSSATVTVSAVVNGDKATLPLTVNLNADQRRLLPSAWGVGLASTPAGSVLSRTLTLRDNFGGALAWTATSDADWLSVTASGNTSGAPTLTLRADPATLPDATLAIATVTVGSSTAGVTPAKIRVGLWKSATAPAAVTTMPGTTYTELVADRIRPYVYAHSGDSSIDVYNAYTAQKIATVRRVGSALGRMAVSPDGSQLYALDTAERSLAVVDLNTLARSATWPLESAVNGYMPLVAARPNGVEVVFVGDGTAYTDGRSLGRGYLTEMIGFATTADAQRVYGMATRYDVDYSAMANGVLFSGLSLVLDARSGGNMTDVAVSPDGSRVYSASGGGVSGSGYRCAVVDGIDGSFIGALPGGDAYPNNVEVTSDGRSLCGIAGAYSGHDFWVYTPRGELLQSYKFSGYSSSLLNRQLVVTPDGVRVVALSDDPMMGFVTIGAP